MFGDAPADPAAAGGAPSGAAAAVSGRTPGATPASGGPGSADVSVDPLRPAPDLAEVTVRIVAQGTIVDPFESQTYSGVGSGTGFIIDPSGVVVTNNHVVAHASIVEVFIGERPEPVAAQVLGVSECNDLAVIDLEGDGYQFLDWFAAPIMRGLAVQAVGYPLGVVQLTQTQGIVSKNEAPAATDWASVDAILEHDARINPGNSGGPLINAVGTPQVVGVNYAGREDTDQNFAISMSVAKPLVERLRTGTDIDSIGINGRAFTDGTVSAIGVYSIAPGSPAERSGIRAGDFITAFGDIQPALDGTMADYCRVLRTQGPQGVIPVQVVRNGQVLEGQLNGVPLAVIAANPPEPETQGTATCSDVCVVSVVIADGVCQDGSAAGDVLCDPGTDCSDCGAGAAGCSDTCTRRAFAGDGACDDGGAGSDFNICDLGTDCGDCGDRAGGGGGQPPPSSSPPPADGVCSDFCTGLALAVNGVCEDGSAGGSVLCDPGSDCTDCGPQPEGCFDDCVGLEFVADGVCDDSGDDALCDFGTDCTDCGPR
jgi:S1-C subfamily serine protease